MTSEYHRKGSDIIISECSKLLTPPHPPPPVKMSWWDLTSTKRVSLVFLQDVSPGWSAVVPGAACALRHLLRRGRAALPAAAALDRGGRPLGPDVLPAASEADPGGETGTCPGAAGHAAAAAAQQLHGGCHAFTGQHAQDSGSSRRTKEVFRCPHRGGGGLLHLRDVCLQDMSLKCNEEGKSLSTETFAKVSLTNLRRQAVPDLASDLGMNIFKKVTHPDARRSRFISCF